MARQLLCLHLCKWLCARRGTCTRICMCEGQRSTSCVITQEPSAFLPKMGSLTGISRWAGQQALGTLLSLSPQYRDYKHLPQCNFLRGPWNQTQVLLLARQALHQLSHFPSSESLCFTKNFPIGTLSQSFLQLLKEKDIAHEYLCLFSLQRNVPSRVHPRELVTSRLGTTTHIWALKPSGPPTGYTPVLWLDLAW